MSIKLKRILYSAMATVMALPALASGVQANASHRRPVRRQVSPITRYVDASMPKRERKTLGLDQAMRRNFYTRHQLKVIFSRTYNLVHKGVTPQKQVRRITDQLANPKARIYNTLIGLYRHNMRKYGSLNVKRPATVNQNQNGRAKVVQPLTPVNTHDFLRSRLPYYYPDINNNFRGLGGYVTKDGKHHVRNRIFRSSRLEHVSRKGRREMRILGINEVVDLRNSKQIRHHRDQRMPVSHVDDSVYTNKAVKVLGNNLKQRGIRGAKARRIAYRKLMVDNKQAMRSYRRLFDILLADRRGSVEFHCSAGRDRTGVASALILSALNVPKASIYRDYELTDVYENGQIGRNQKQFLDVLYNEANRRYGGIKGYLHHIGVNNRMIRQLQKMYLTPNKQVAYNPESTKSTKSTRPAKRTQRPKKAKHTKRAKVARHAKVVRKAVRPKRSRNKAVANANR